MSDMREYHVDEPEVSSSRSKLLGAAIVALGLGALGAYSFASGDLAKPGSQQLASNQVRTTPEYGGQNMPPPVTATPVPVTPQPVTPQSDKPKVEKKVEKPKTEDQQAVVTPKEPMAPPSPIQTPPENAAPPQQPDEAQPADQQQATPPDQPQPQ